MKKGFFISTLGVLALAFSATANVIDVGCGCYANGTVNATVVTSGGKIVIGGNFTSVNGQSRPYIARLNNDCTVDTSFGSYVNGEVFAIAVQADGKLVIVGNFSLVQNFYKVPGLARLFADDGQYDPLFGPATLNYYPQSVAVQADGKILIGGHFTYVGGIYNPGLARLNYTGSRDSYNPMVFGGVYSIALHPNDGTTNAGKAYIGGYFDGVHSFTRKNVARIKTDGNLDLSFNTSNGPNSVVWAVAVPMVGCQVDRILIGGDFTSIGGVERLRIAALTPHGQAHPAFNSSANGTVRSILWRPSGNTITIGGCFTQVNGLTRRGVARYPTAWGGHIDDWNSGPGAGGGIGTPCVYSLSPLTGGMTFVGGTFTTWDGGSRPYLARLLANNY